jgi:hypothetical protein
MAAVDELLDATGMENWNPFIMKDIHSGFFDLRSLNDSTGLVI